VLLILAVLGCGSWEAEPTIDLLSMAGAPALVDTRANVDEEGNLLDAIESVTVIPRWTYRVAVTDPVDRWPVVRFEQFRITYDLPGVAASPPAWEGVVSGSLGPGETVDVAIRPADLEQLNWFSENFDGAPVTTVATLTVQFHFEGSSPGSVERSWPFEVVFADVQGGGLVPTEEDTDVVDTDTDSQDTDTDSQDTDTDIGDTDPADTDAPDSDTP